MIQQSHVYCKIKQAKIWNQPKCLSMGEWIKNVLFIHTHTHIVECYLAMRNNEILPYVTTWMNLEGIMLNEMSERERQILHSITYMWNLKKLNLYQAF